MKKILIVLIAGLFLTAGNAFAYSWPKSVTADGAAYALPGYVTAIVGVTDGTNDLTIIIYDNASAASGTKVAEFTVSASSGWDMMPLPDVKILKGAYVDLTTAGTGSVYVYIKEE